MEILLGDFKAEHGGEEMSKPLIGNEGSHEISNDNAVRAEIFYHIKILFVKSSHRNIRNYTWTYPDGRHNQTDHVLTDKTWHSSAFDARSFRELSVILNIIWCLQRTG
jgi:hypothetical protein